MKLTFEPKDFTLGTGGILRGILIISSMISVGFAIKERVNRVESRVSEADSSRSAEFTALHRRLDRMEQENNEFKQLLETHFKWSQDVYYKEIIPIGKDVTYIRDRVASLEKWREQKDENDRKYRDRRWGGGDDHGAIQDPPRNEQALEEPYR